ncbi:uncharacterized protein BT62DRAFT_938952 [Guyanagaster necrorhizus]|uniref:Uncharacterized protein n=1 Tax=Guyanagaster necrorhizus TaxID=856835 RepID=A0A9P8AKQ8_9AGAR|nr:uncharacterized protein BT62DRAFT_938952 [Guyanagaster necrorhizus MCA 3950]KAG7439458.1 hypothetical protein BT62DRAFT_938952 [Guyanagaster necrorhizus MCA 3950]
MKLSVISCLVAGASLVSAVPMRVVMLTGSSDGNTSPALRFGHAGVSHEDAVVPTSMPAAIHGRPCGGGRRFRDKAVKLSNSFRQALGLPLIESEPKADTTVHGGVIRIMPFIGGPATVVQLNETGDEGKTRGGDRVRIVNAVPMTPGRHGHHRVRLNSQESFTSRLHYALMMLGPWEGRAVAFVLGCGIGVLLRMIWVLTLVSYRAFRGERETHEYSHLPHGNAEEIVVAPPTYIYVDEKTPIVDTDAKHTDAKPTEEEAK